MQAKGLTVKPAGSTAGDDGDEVVAAVADAELVVAIVEEVGARMPCKVTKARELQVKHPTQMVNVARAAATDGIVTMRLVVRRTWFLL